MVDEDDVFRRWSKRKRAVAQEEARESPGPDEPYSAPVVEDGEDETALLQRLNLPVPETMHPGDDFSAFMKAGVPEFLRKRALRTLWRSNPVLANLDGLNDYDDDFTSPEMTQKVLATAYRVGRGFLRPDPPPDMPHDSDAEDSAERNQSPEQLSETSDGKAGPDAADAAGQDVARKTDDEVDLSFQPRRMRFKT